MKPLQYKIFFTTAVMLIHASFGYSQGNNITWTDNHSASSSVPILVLSANLTNQNPFDTKRQGCRAAVYTGELRKDRKYEIRLNSDKMDTYLRLESANGVEIAQNDDGGGGTNSRLFIQPQVTGTYRLIVTTYSQNETGPYQLSMTSTPAPTKPNPIVGGNDPNAKNLLFQAEGVVGISGIMEQRRYGEMFNVGIGSTTASKLVLEGSVPLMMVIKNSKGQTVLEVKNLAKANKIEAVLSGRLISGRYETLQIYVMPATPRSEQTIRTAPYNRTYRYIFKVYAIPTA